MRIPEIEQKILKNWREIDAFKKSVEKRPRSRTSTGSAQGTSTNPRYKGNFVFYEGPPTANGMPHPGHILTRCFKDVICRYKTMQGYRVERRAGWDMHGLPVEIEVEKELGLKNKKDIEKYGIAKFNKKCKESVWKYKKAWEDMTERIGFWIDMSDPYITSDPLYMESLWWIIKQAYEKDLLYEGYKVVPYCPRCGTGLSSHEVALGYQTIKENSVFVKFKIKGSPPSLKLRRASQKVYFLAWTTTPWTLPGNVALAVGKSIKYQVLSIKGANEIYILAKDLVEKVIDTEYEILDTISGKDLLDIQYEPLFDSLKNTKEKKYYVVGADFVTTDEGTGIVHTAVMYGEDDYQLGDKFGLPKKHTVDEEGRFNELVPEFEGQFVKDAEPAIIEKLRAENKLYKVQEYEHSYPFCWRCETPLLYYARNSWFMAMSRLKKDLIAANKKINWEPEYIKDGRFGEWLREVKDWAFSRSRYWATPLPIWKCNKCDAQEVVGSREDLARLTKGHNEYYLIRHGESESNVRRILNSTDSAVKFEDGLTEMGLKQIKTTVKKLKAMGNFDFIISSPMLRTKQTAEIIAKELGIEVQYDDGFREVTFGALDARPYEEYNKIYEISDTYEFEKKPQGGESKAEVRARTSEAIKNLEKKYKDKKILVVSHADSIWHMRNTYRGLTRGEAAQEAKKDYPKNGNIYKIEYTDFPYNDEGELDFHRPYVDEIKFGCAKCEQGTMERIEELVDVWYDSGAMPFAQAHWPFVVRKSRQGGGQALVRGQEPGVAMKSLAYPADYIVEGIDQTRGWFYTLLAVSAILDKAPSYKNVISLGLALDEDGKKMSKRKRNYADPMELADKYGIDAVRWYFFTVNHPGAPKRLAENDIRERWQKFIGTFLNSYTFLNTYSPKIKAPVLFSAKTGSNVLDKWIVTRLKQIGYGVIEALDQYNTLDAARNLDSFVLEDLSNWYIRRSRGRFQRPATKKEKDEASRTLAFVLSELAKLTAPFVPFISEHIWQSVNKTEKRSVHWELLPKYKKPTKSDEKLLQNMEELRQWAQVGLSLRVDNSLKVRQPLEAFAISKKLSKNYQLVLREELNVKKIVNISQIEDKKGWVFSKDKKIALKITLSSALELEGQAREMVRHIQKLRRALKLNPKDKIRVEYSLPQSLHSKLQKLEAGIASDTNAAKISEQKVKGEKHDASVEYNWDSKKKAQVVIDKV